ncbi:VCBS repeat-containing protein [Wocania ichthyoenteri]|uniref:VCBS repeat-containing protein n=1 Tax=Wocania ichthyoenteri TaxID=1230531 RepID=UPI00053EBE5C|nr:VCBS repeat-containing protein [Wocania ichthyoenteri]
MKLVKSIIISALSSLILFSCTTKNKVELLELPLFRALNSEESGVNFTNHITISDSLNFFNFGYIYSGGGVAIGDLNNDGLQDIFFVGNQVGNRLYLNKGDLKFKDITTNAHLKTNNKWCTGVTMADVNGDGYLDIYVSVSGTKKMDRKNLLYINNQDLTFTESAEISGVSDNGYSSQSTFFDYDRDGDLDLFVANYPPAGFQNSQKYYRNKMDNVQEEDTDHLFENNGEGVFINVTKKAGLFSYGLSLSATVGDFNQDGWPDIYVSNDFSTPDYFYFNNGDGTFKEANQNTTKNTSFYGMGVDVADFNNDKLLDIFQAEMNPEDNFRAKANMSSMNIPLFWEAVSLGFGYQYMQNSLQLNQGIKENGLPFFSNVSRISGVSSTDWSWAPLFIDMDNDGWKDIFITNGIRRDINNKDFFKRLEKPAFVNQFKTHKELAEAMPFSKVPNYAFKNNGGIKFENISSNWGLDFKGFSNGASYGDLDNDGDLDIVVNNVDSVAVIFENRSNNISKKRFLRFKLKGDAGNTFGVGTKIELNNNGDIQFQEFTMTRGYLSSVEPIVHFGTGELETVKKVTITWPDGRQQELHNVPTNKIITIDYKNSNEQKFNSYSSPQKYLKEVSVSNGLFYTHIENDYDDFKKEPLLPHKTSQFGPGIAVSDINHDGLDDLYIGGAKGSKGKLMVQLSDGKFEELSGPWDNDYDYEDIGAIFFDADQDNDFDLYVVSGGNEFEIDSPLLEDRLYINEGLGKFHKSLDALPKMRTSGSCVVSLDFDKDGDMDLFVGGRLIPGKYPFPANSYLLENVGVNGKAKFTDITKESAPSLLKPGLVTASVASDFDSDGDLDLIIVGEWMPISFFENDKGYFKDVTEIYGMTDTVGWWSSIITDDFDDDGIDDYVVGNLGRNYKYQATKEQSFDIFVADFDNNKKQDLVLGYYNEGVQYPVRGRQCSAQQVPELEFKFKSYTDFAKATIQDVYTEEALKSSLHYKAKTFSSLFIKNTSNKRMEIIDLPESAQISSINGMISRDFNQDGNKDILAVGNLFASEVETPRNDASYGFLLVGDGMGNFSKVNYQKSGLYVPGDAKAISVLKTGSKNLIVVANNNAPMQVFEIK